MTKKTSGNSLIEADACSQSKENCNTKEKILMVKRMEDTSGQSRKTSSFHIQEKLCKGCGLCKKTCPVDAISGDIKTVHCIDCNKCIGCGICLQKCKFKAIEVWADNQAEQMIACPICGKRVYTRAQIGYVKKKLGTEWHIYDMCEECRIDYIAYRICRLYLSVG